MTTYLLSLYLLPKRGWECWDWLWKLEVWRGRYRLLPHPHHNRRARAGINPGPPPARDLAVP